MISHRTLVLTALAAAAACSRPEPAKQEAPASPSHNIQTREVEYREGNTPLKGFFAWDSAGPAKKPGVLVVHEWWGHNQHARNQAKRLADAGYVGFALDMYGNGKVTSHPDSAEKFMAEAVKNPAVLMARFQAALAELKSDPHVDTTRIGAIGYCFGGAVVLSAARAGADLDAVATFHGALSGLAPVDSGKVKPRILVMTGGADPMVPTTAVEAFKKEMEKAGARVEVITYPNAKHSFTNPDADKVGMPGLAYDAEADRQSWAELLKMFGEALK